MGRIDKAYIYNAGSRDHTKPQIIKYKGKRRRQLWPAGTVERFVNLQGTVIQAVLVPPGVPASANALASARAKLHSHKTPDGDVVGFIEHGKCPLKTGVADLDPVIADECERMREACGPACKEHPVTVKVTRAKPTKQGRAGKVVEIEYFDGCPHVQWMIEERRTIHRAKADARMKKQKSVRELEQDRNEIETAKLAAAEQQARDTRALLERVVDKMDRAESRPRGKQAASEPSE
jgi:hypothetical protein